MRVTIPEPTLVIPPFVGGAPERSIFQQTSDGEEWMLLFERPGDMPSSNTRMHYMKRAGVSRAWRAAAAEMAFFMPNKPGRWYVRVSLPFRRAAARRDPHNFTATVVKPTIDGCVDAGVWMDDTAEYVHVGDPICRVVRRPDRLLVGVHAWRLDDD